MSLFLSKFAHPAGVFRFAFAPPSETEMPDMTGNG